MICFSQMNAFCNRLPHKIAPVIWQMISGLLKTICTASTFILLAAKF